MEEELEKGGVLVFGETGTGKTELAVRAAKRLAAKGYRVLYLVPTVSLADEVAERLGRELGRRIYPDYAEIRPAMFPGYVERAWGQPVVVATYETALSRLATSQAARRSVEKGLGAGTVAVVDEVEYLSSPARAAGIIALVYSLRALGVPVNYLSIDMSENTLEELRGIVPVRETVYTGKRPEPVEVVREEAAIGIEEADTEKYRRWVTGKAMEWAKRLVLEGRSVIVFRESRRGVEELAQKARAWAVSEGIDPSIVAYYHSLLGRRLKYGVVKAFLEGRVRLLFATSSLASGVNTPADAVIIAGTVYGSPFGSYTLEPQVIVNMVGRAGRPSLARTRGLAVLVGGVDEFRYTPGMPGTGAYELALLNRYEYGKVLDDASPMAVVAVKAVVGEAWREAVRGTVLEDYVYQAARIEARMKELWLIAGEPPRPVPRHYPRARGMTPTGVLLAAWLVPPRYWCYVELGMVACDRRLPDYFHMPGVLAAATRGLRVSASRRTRPALYYAKTYVESFTGLGGVPKNLVEERCMQPDREAWEGLAASLLAQGGPASQHSAGDYLKHFIAVMAHGTYFNASKVMVSASSAAALLATRAEETGRTSCRDAYEAVASIYYWLARMYAGEKKVYEAVSAYRLLLDLYAADPSGVTARMIADPRGLVEELAELAKTGKGKKATRRRP